MAWTDSHVFQCWLADSLTRLNPFDMNTDTFKAALYNDTITPDRNVANTAAAYGTGVWATAAPPQVFQAGQWAQGGVALTNPTINSGTPGVVFWSAGNVASGSAATLTNAVGVLVYDASLTATPGPANAGVCFNFLGGPNSVTNGTFTVVWNGNGIWRATV